MENGPLEYHTSCINAVTEGNRLKCVKYFNRSTLKYCINEIWYHLTGVSVLKPLWDDWGLMKLFNFTYLARGSRESELINIKLTFALRSVAALNNK